MQVKDNFDWAKGFIKVFKMRRVPTEGLKIRQTTRWMGLVKQAVETDQRKGFG